MNSKGSRRHRLNFWLVSASSERQGERDKQTNQRRIRSKQGDNKWVLAHEKKHTSNFHFARFQHRADGYGATSSRVTAFICVVSGIQKCNIMSDKLSPLFVGVKQKHDIYQECNDYELPH